MSGSGRFIRSVLVFAAAVAVVACGASSSTGVTTPPASGTPAAGPAVQARSNACGYLTPGDFQQSLGFSLSSSGGTSSVCSYTDTGGDTCNLTVGTAGTFDAYRSAASAYGSVDSLAVGDQSFYAAKIQDAATVWVFDVGFTSKGVFIDMICGATFGTDNPKAKAAALAQVLAARL